MKKKIKINKRKGKNYCLWKNTNKMKKVENLFKYLKTVSKT